METLNAKFHKSSKEWSDQGSRLFNDTRTAGKHFADFVQHEAKDWGDYLSEHKKNFGDQGWGLLRPDSLMARLRDYKVAKTEQENAEEVEMASDAEETEEVENTAVVEIEKESDEEIKDEETDDQL